MERVYAFTDEYGQFGWDMDKEDVSTCFIITAVIVGDSAIDVFMSKAEEIRKKYFQTGEIKSSKVGSNAGRRKAILSELQGLPFEYFTVVIDKKSCLENMTIQGLKYKKSFYKFMNNIVYKEIRQAFTKLTIIADSIGNNDYMKSFCKYVDERQDITNLLGEAEFMFDESHHNAGIQIADFISGTLARVYDENKKDIHAKEYFDLVQRKAIRIEQYPKPYDVFPKETSPLTKDYDMDIAELCHSLAVTYIANNKDSEEQYTIARILVLKYLLYRFINNDEKGYISTRELRGALKYIGLGNISDQAFRSNIIGPLRDDRIIIASSNKGYKIPSSLSEIKDYVLHDARVVMPMLSRLQKCRNLVKLRTINAVDLLEDTGFEGLIGFFDNYPFEELDNNTSE